MMKQKEKMKHGTIRLPLMAWSEIELLQSRLGLKDKSECIRVIIALGLNQLKDKGENVPCL
jgi:hypothetical protein